VEVSQRRVLVVDDDRDILDMLRVLLAREPYALFTTSTPEATLALIGEHAIEVVIVDAHMPAMPGLTLLRELSTRFPEVTRMMLTGSGDMDVAAAAINEGAVFRLLTKPPEPSVLRQAIRDALEVSGKRQKEAVLLRLHREQKRLMEELYDRGDGSVDEVVRSRPDLTLPKDIAAVLSPREAEVVLALAREGDTESVARVLCVSPHTVRTHLKAVFRKLEVHSQAALLSRLYALGVRAE